MRKFKTAEDNRTNYIYYFNDGTSYTITPGKNGENATIISQLHGMDDEELDAQRREAYHCPVHLDGYHNGTATMRMTATHTLRTIPTILCSRFSLLSQTRSVPFVWKS